jgi:hypothetical protein
VGSPFGTNFKFQFNHCRVNRPPQIDSKGLSPSATIIRRLTLGDRGPAPVLPCREVCRRSIRVVFGWENRGW